MFVVFLWIVVFSTPLRPGIFIRTRHMKLVYPKFKDVVYCFVLGWCINLFINVLLAFIVGCVICLKNRTTPAEFVISNFYWLIVGSLVINAMLSGLNAWLDDCEIETMLDDEAHSRRGLFLSGRNL